MASFCLERTKRKLQEHKKKERETKRRSGNVDQRPRHEEMVEGMKRRLLGVQKLFLVSVGVDVFLLGVTTS